MARSVDDLAVLFPGQGVGDPSSVELVRECKPGLLALATASVGSDPYLGMRDSTRFAQPAVYCATLACYEMLGRPRAAFMAGHSLGEIAALAAAGAIAEEDGLRIAVERGRLMHEAAQECGGGGMLALGLNLRDAEAIARDHGLTIANDNSPDQVVVSGGEDAIAAAHAQARVRRLRSKRLRIAGPFHTEAMAPIVPAFREVLDDIAFKPPSATVMSCATAAPFESNPRDALAQALVSPVRWVDVLRRLRFDGARRFIDVGPGRVLAGLVRRTLHDALVEPPPAVDVARA